MYLLANLTFVLSSMKRDYFIAEEYMINNMIYIKITLEFRKADSTALYIIADIYDDIILTHGIDI